MKLEQPWIEKYKPQNVKGLVGNTEAIVKIVNWLQIWPRSIVRNRRALMIYGPAGVGKTISIHAIAEELGYEVSEINSSVKRSKKMIDELLKTSTMSGTLTKSRGRLVLVDELAGLSGKSDRGAASALKTHIQSTRVPIILVTNDISEAKIRPLRKLCTLIEFKPVEPNEITELLNYICQQEKLVFEDEAIEQLAINSRGDVRGAINDLQAIAKTGLSITKDTVLDFLKSRDYTIGTQEAIDKIFYANTWAEAVNVANQTDIYPDELLRWISSNVSLVFPDLTQQIKALEFLSRASIFYRRISRTQNWRLLPYSKELMCITRTITGGTPNSRHPNYRFPDWISQMGFSRSLRQKRSLVGQLLSPIVHLSSKKAYREYIDILRVLLNNSKTKNTIILDLGLSEELVQFITKQ
ncbi:MAG: replication factor C large subunit [Candidatus Thorarchaeota archaeon]